MIANLFLQFWTKTSYKILIHNDTFFAKKRPFGKLTPAASPQKLPEVFLFPLLLKKNSSADRNNQFCQRAHPSFRNNVAETICN